MDFSVLSRYDDMLASYFVDGLFLWYDTLRMNADFVASPVGTQQAVDRIRQLIVHESLHSKAVKDAAESFLKLPYFEEFVGDFPAKQLQEFTQHMKRYLYMYRPNAGFEVGSTTRYTGKPEACIIATKHWQAGEQVICCLGQIAALSEQDDLKLKREGRDFSVMVSTRKKCTCLFLGPARFMNHDCDSNCEFILIGQNAITFRVLREIQPGEEMTVFYADHYFGEDNCECMCVSCERLQQGHFSVPSLEEATTENSESEVGTPTSSENKFNTRRSGRKRKDITYRDYYVPEQVKRQRTNSGSSQEIRNSPSPLLEITNAEENIKMDSNVTDEPEQYCSIQNDNIINGKELPSPTAIEQFVVEEAQSMFVQHPDIYTQQKDDHMVPKTEDDIRDVFDWMDELSELSDDEAAPTTLNCCPQAQRYCMGKRRERSDLCGRCNRHFQIFGFEWPQRRMKKPNWRNKLPLAIVKEEIIAKPVRHKKRVKAKNSLHRSNMFNNIKSASASDKEPIIFNIPTPDVIDTTEMINQVSKDDAENENELGLKIRVIALRKQDEKDRFESSLQAPRNDKLVWLDHDVATKNQQLHKLTQEKRQLQQLKNKLIQHIYPQPLYLTQRVMKQQATPVGKDDTRLALQHKQLMETQQQQQIETVPLQQLQALAVQPPVASTAQKVDGDVDEYTTPKPKRPGLRAQKPRQNKQQALAELQKQMALALQDQKDREVREAQALKLRQARAQVDAVKIRQLSLEEQQRRERIINEKTRAEEYKLLMEQRKMKLEKQKAIRNMRRRESMAAQQQKALFQLMAKREEASVPPPTPSTPPIPMMPSALLNAPVHKEISAVPAQPTPQQSVIEVASPQQEVIEAEPAEQKIVESEPEKVEESYQIMLMDKEMKHTFVQKHTMLLRKDDVQAQKSDFTIQHKEDSPVHPSDELPAQQPKVVIESEEKNVTVAEDNEEIIIEDDDNDSIVIVDDYDILLTGEQRVVKAQYLPQDLLDQQTEKRLMNAKEIEQLLELTEQRKAELVLREEAEMAKEREREAMKEMENSQQKNAQHALRREAEAIRKREIEQVEAEAARQNAAHRDTEARNRRQAEIARQKMEEEAAKRREAQAANQREIEAEKQRKAEARKKKEAEAAEATKQKAVDLARRRLEAEIFEAEAIKKQEAELLRQRNEEKQLRLIKQREAEAARQRIEDELARQRQVELARFQETERCKEMQAHMAGQKEMEEAAAVEVERQRRAVAAQQHLLEVQRREAEEKRQAEEAYMEQQRKTEQHRREAELEKLKQKREVTALQKAKIKEAQERDLLIELRMKAQVQKKKAGYQPRDIKRRTVVHVPKTVKRSDPSPVEDEEPTSSRTRNAIKKKESSGASLKKIKTEDVSPNLGPMKLSFLLNRGSSEPSSSAQRQQQQPVVKIVNLNPSSFVQSSALPPTPLKKRTVIQSLPRPKTNTAKKPKKSAFPIAPPNKGNPIQPPRNNFTFLPPMGDITRRTLIHEPPPPRTLPPPALASSSNVPSSRRCSTPSDIGPYLPIEYNNC